MKNYFEENKLRWNKLPGGKSRVNIGRLLNSPEWWLRFRYNNFIKFWQKERAWEHERYSQLFKGRDVLEVGGGMGYDGMVYSKTVNTHTYAELNELQLAFIKRVTGLYGVTNARYEWMNSLQHAFPNTYNAFYAHGVLHHVPFETARLEFDNINKYLQPGTIAVFLMYPKKRWELCGKPSFEKFGKYTDGGCPWAEWYDEEKILHLVGPEYELQKTTYWGWKNAEFVNFELLKK